MLCLTDRYIDSWRSRLLFSDSCQKWPAGLAGSRPDPVTPPWPDCRRHGYVPLADSDWWRAEWRPTWRQHVPINQLGQCQTVLFASWGIYKISVHLLWVEFAAECWQSNMNWTVCYLSLWYTRQKMADDANEIHQLQLKLFTVAGGSHLPGS